MERLRERWAALRGRLAPRQLLLPAIVLVELLLLFALGNGRTSPAAPADAGPALRVFDVARQDLAPTPPLPPTEPTEVIVPPPLIDVPAPSPMVVSIAPLPPASAPVGAAGPACDVNGAMLATLRTDPLAAQAITRVPRQNRSVANALQIWNGRWADAAQLGGAETVQLLRHAVANGLARLPPGCRDQGRVGPAFFLVPQEGEDIMIVIGSDNWSWGQLLLPDTEDSERNG